MRSSSSSGIWSRRVDRPAVRPRKLVQPDVGALGQQHDPRHPVEVVAEALELRIRRPAAEIEAVQGAGIGSASAPRRAGSAPPSVAWKRIHSARSSSVRTSRLIDQPIAELLGGKAPVGRRSSAADRLSVAAAFERRPAQQADQVLVVRAKSRLGLEPVVEALDHRVVGRALPRAARRRRARRSGRSPRSCWPARGAAAPRARSRDWACPRSRPPGSRGQTCRRGRRRWSGSARRTRAGLLERLGGTVSVRAVKGAGDRLGDCARAGRARRRSAGSRRRGPSR